MAIVSISRGSQGLGIEVAELVASRLGYECIGRELLLEASQRFDVPEVRLIEALDHPRSMLDHLFGGAETYIVFMKAALFEHLRRNNVVYHGVLGAHLLCGVGHMLKARVLAEMPDRVQLVMTRDGVSAKKALKIIKASDQARVAWGHEVHGVDLTDPSLYDIVLNVSKMGAWGAADVICDLIKQEAYNTTPESQALIDEAALVANTEALLLGLDISLEDVEISAKGNEVTIGILVAKRRSSAQSKMSRFYRDDKLRRIREETSRIVGVRYHIDLVECQ